MKRLDVIVDALWEIRRKYCATAILNEFDKPRMNKINCTSFSDCQRRELRL